MSGFAERKDFRQSARTAWGETMPEWVAVLAEYAMAHTLAQAAREVGCSAGLVSNVLNKKYQASTARIEQRVRGALMNEKVECPVLGDLGRDQCLAQQALGNTGASPARARLYRKCRGIGTERCAHSRLPEGAR